MNKLLISLYGIFSYLVGLTGLTAFMLYMGSWSFLPIHINSKVADSTSMQAIFINLLILVLFGLHHTITARSGFKNWLTQYIPASVERSTYVLISGLFMYAICIFWQPLTGMVWSTDNAAVIVALQILHVFGWLVLVAATFEIDHFHLMGLRQSLTMHTAESGQLKENFLYRIVRHPIQTGVLLGIWSTANMSATQFMLSLCLTIYMFIGLYFEEKSLVDHFGDSYLDYKNRVPAIIPFWPRKN